MGALKQDVSDALRGMWRQPGFVAVVAVSLGVGLGAAGAVLSLVDAVLIRPLPYPEVEQVYGVWFKSPNFPGGLDRVRQSPATFVHLRDQNRTFAAVALADAAMATIDDGQRVRRDPSAWVTADLFRVLGVEAERGRALDEGDSAPGAEPVVVISHDYWATRFGARTDAVGSFLDVDGVRRRIVGVLPQGVRFPETQTGLWLPLTIDPTRLEGSDFVNTGYVRLRPGVDLATADADFMRMVDLLPETYPTFFPRPLLARLQLSSLFVPLKDELVGDVRQPLLVVLLGVGAVLVIVATNVAGLFIVRNASRLHDLAVRTAAGAPVSRVVRAVHTEALVYGLVGALLGLVGAWGTLGLLRRVGAGVIPRISEVGLGLRPTLAILLVALALSVAVASFTLVRLRALDLGAALRAGGKSVGPARRTVRLRRLLVAAQVSLAVVLLVNTGLLLRTARGLQAVPLGFQTGQQLGLRVFLPERDYPSFDDARRFHHETVDALLQLPGVEAASAASFLPQRDGRVFVPWQVEGDLATADLPTPRLLVAVDAGYAEALGIPVLEGRTLTRQDALTEQPVVAVSQAFAETYWPGRSALGQRIRSGSQGPWLSVVGVLGDVRQRELAEPPPPIVYAPLVESASTARWREMSFVVRAPDPERLIPVVADLIGARDRSVPVYDVETLDHTLGAVTARLRYTLWLTLAAAVSAVFLCAVGLYGLLAQVVTEGRQEMAVRLALGATNRSVQSRVLRQALGVVGAGIGAGLLATAFSTRVLRSLLFDVSTTDPAAMGAAVTLLVVVALGAAWLPARKAAALPPALILRES